MPIISRFFGIVVALYWGDHSPPHFHAKYGGQESAIDIPHIVKARYKREYQIWLKFNDGSEGIVDLADELYGTMFRPLRDKSKFKAFRVDRELETVVWDNGADLAPEFLRDRLTAC